MSWFSWGREFSAAGRAETGDTIVWDVESGGKLGLHFARTAAVLYTIEKISPDGLAAQHPAIQPGVRLLSVQRVGQDRATEVGNLPYDTALDLLRGDRRPLRLVFARDTSRVPAASASTNAVGAAEEQQRDSVMDEEEEFGLRVEVGSEVERALVERVERILRMGAHDVEDADFWIPACLRSRKFEPMETVELLKKYMAWREERNINMLGGLFNERLRSQLASGFLQLPGARDRRGRLLLHMFARFIDTSTFSADETTRSAHFMVEAALRACPAAQARGVIFLIDMTDTTETAASSCLRSLFPLLASSSLPIRVGAILIVNPPPFFGFLLPIAQQLLSAKMRARLCLVTKDGNYSELRALLDDHSLPVDYGGRLSSAHGMWMAALEACLSGEESGEWPPLQTVPSMPPSAPLPGATEQAGLDAAALERLQLFRRYDGDEDGRVTRYELRQLLQEIFKGGMDEAWFADIWSTCTAPAAHTNADSAETAADNVMPGLCDFATFCKLFDDDEPVSKQAVSPTRAKPPPSSASVPELAPSPPSSPVDPLLRADVGPTSARSNG